jgi:flagellar hook assembly protein FlgD
VPNVPSQFYIYQNYPNPFNPYTKIDFFVATRGNIQLVIFDMLGRQIRTLVDGIVEAGLQTVSWDGRDTQGKTVSSGVYFYQLKRRPDFTNTQKMILLK